MNNWIDKITHEPLRHWHRFLKGFAIFMVGIMLWYSKLALVYFSISDAAIHSYSVPSKIIALVFLIFGIIISAVGYLQILICRLLPSKTVVPRNQ
jgi:hypothetical protein